MISVLPTHNEPIDKTQTTLDLVPPSNSLFKLKHLEFFCGKIPVKIYFDKHSGIHIASIEASSTNLTNISVNYVTCPFPSGIPNATAQLILQGTNGGLSADRFDHYLGNVFSSHSMNINVEADHTSFSFDLIGGTSGYAQLLNLLLDSISNPASIGNRDFKYQIFNNEDQGGKLFECLQHDENQLKNAVNKARFIRTFSGSTHGRDYIGTSQDLRQACTLDKIQQYAQRFYQNPWICLTEKLHSELDHNLFDSLSMKQSLNKRDRPNSIVENYANYIDLNRIKDIQFHYSDVMTVYGNYQSEDRGIVQIGFLADPPTNVTFMEAIGILSEYLCSSKTSHLNSMLANGENAVCSSVSIELKVSVRCEVVVQLNDVPKRFLNKGIVERFFDAVQSIQWDLQQIQEIILQKVRQYSELTEGNISKAVFDRLRLFQLYADSNDAVLLKRLLNPALVLSEILQLSTVYWEKFVRNLFVENCSAVIGVPNNNSVDNLILERQITTPVHNDRKRKLRRSTELLKDIYRPSDVLYSQEMIDVASASIYPFHKIFPTTFKSFHWNITGSKLNLLPEWFKHVKDVIDPTIPFTVTVHTVDSEFVEAVFLFDISDVELKLRQYMLVFMRLLFSSASSSVNGNFMSPTEIEQALKKDVLKSECELGFDKTNCHIFHLTFKVSATKLELIEKWFHGILCNVVFDVEDIARVVCDLLKSTQEARKNGLLFCNTLLDFINLQREKNELICNEIVLDSFHNELLDLLSSDRHQQIIDNLMLLRNQILNSKINLHLIGSPKKFASSHRLNFDDLKRFHANTKVEKITIKQKSQLYWPLKSEIHVISSHETKPLGHLVERLSFKCDQFDENHAAILVLCKYFSTKGGIFWRCISEDGQAKSAKLHYDVNKQMLTLTIESAKNVKITRQLISYLLRQMFVESMDTDLFKVSQRSLAAQIVEPYSNVQSAGLISIQNDVSQWTVDQITSFIHKILVLKESRCQYLLYDTIIQLTNEKNLKAISCATFQTNSVLKDFQDILQPIPLIQHTSDQKFELLTS